MQLDLNFLQSELALESTMYCADDLRAFLQGGRIPLLEGLPYQKSQNIALLYK